MAKGNADNKAPDSFDDKEFFEEMENDVSSESEPTGFFGEVEKERTQEKQVDKEKENLAKRYADSSKEAKRLAELNKQLESKINEIEPFIPVIDEMQKNPDFLNHVKRFYEEGNEQQSIKEKLKLPEDFIPDMEDVVNNPESDSAKFFREMVRNEAVRIVKDNNQAQEQSMTEKQRKQQIEAERAKLKKDYNLTDSDLQELDEWANNNTLTYDMLYALKNLSERDKKVVLNSVNNQKKQRERMGVIPPSLGNKGSSQDMTEDDLIFEAIRKSANAGNILR